MHTPLWSLIVLALFLGRLPAQVVEKIAGTVSTGEKKAKVPRAKVHLFEANYHELRTGLVRSAVSDAEGKFAFEGIPRINPKDFGFRHYYLVVEAAGYAVHLRNLRATPIKMDELELVMARPAPIEGKVTGSDGQPLRHATIWVRQVSNPGGHTVFLQAPNLLLRTRTDNGGRYRLRNLARGARVEVEAKHAAHAPQRKRGSAPGTLDFALEPGATAVGRVVYPDGKPAAFVLVCAQSCRHSYWGNTRTDKDGCFRLQSMVPADYNIWANVKDWTMRAHKGFALTGGKVVKTPDIELTKGGFIAGLVVDTNGKPVRPGKVCDVGLYGPSRPRPGAAIEVAQIKDDGSFKLRVAPGSNYVYLRADDRTWRATIGNHTVDVDAGKTVRVEFVVQQIIAADLRRKKDGEIHSGL